MKKVILYLSVVILLCGFTATGHAMEVDSLGGVQIHGFISQGYLTSNTYNYLTNDSKQGSFQFNEVGLNFSKQVTDKLRIGAQFFSRDLGDAANNKVTLDWAYGDYRFEDWLGVRAGRIKLPFGLYNETRDIDMLRTCIVLPQGIYNDLLRDSMIALNGASLYGTIPISAAGSLDYQALVGVANIDADSGTGKQTSSGLQGGTVSDFNTKTEYAGSLRWNTPVSGLALKASFFKANNEMPITLGTLTFDMHMKNLFQIYSIEYFWNNLMLSAEYMTRKTDLAALGQESKIRSESYYAMASYRFTDWLEAGAYYTEYYPDVDDKDGTQVVALGQKDFNAWQKDAALFARFDVNSYTTFKLEGHYVDGAADVLSLDNPTRDDKDWMYFAAKVTFSF